ncbi:unnamed protein product [Phytomonas sp. Hart1]|nr:unnamed protein product [Phytomonas sp. Hart1]|eukprot:CCW69517.1 unnamed protein product [Phytomonas sp. isolate Hart1]
MIELGDIELQSDDENSKIHKGKNGKCNPCSGNPQTRSPSLKTKTDANIKLKSRNNGSFVHSVNLPKQRDREFTQRKAQILANLGGNACDLSPKGTVDAKCLPIMAILNTYADYITTSSCSGRIALFHSHSNIMNTNTELNGLGEGFLEGTASKGLSLKRGSGNALGWLLVKHGALFPAEMLAAVRYLCGFPSTDEDRALDEAQMCYWQSFNTEEDAFQSEMEGVLLEAGRNTSWMDSNQDSKEDGGLFPEVPTFGTICLKMEPFVMHVECRSMESAKRLLSAAVSDAGYRNSGVIPPGRRIMCAMRSTSGCGMEVPVVSEGVNYVRQQRAYVWALLKLANEKMLHNENRVKLLCKSIKCRLGEKSVMD